MMPPSNKAATGPGQPRLARAPVLCHVRAQPSGLSIATRPRAALPAMPRPAAQPVDLPATLIPSAGPDWRIYPDDPKEQPRLWRRLRNRWIWCARSGRPRP